MTSHHQSISHVHRRSHWTQRASARMAAGPWFDPLALFALKRWMFPLSRLWAAAQDSGGNVERFMQAVPITPTNVNLKRVAAAIAATQEARLVAEATDAVWNETFFGDGKTTNAQLRTLERARHGRRHAFYAKRRLFRFLRDRSIPLSRQIIEPPDAAVDRHRQIIDGKVQLAPLPKPLPEVRLSQPLVRGQGVEHWLRFTSPSPVMRDEVRAHVFSPIGVTNPPTLIFGHGIGVEGDHWLGLLDEIETLVAQGVRVIRPEAPWHGYRTPNGYYGGERIIEVFPSGAIDAFAAALQEWAVLANWARATSTGPLAFGGTSLGALIAQRAADESQHWPPALAPDALFLITHSSSILEIIIDGDLTRLWGDPEQAKAVGWDIEQAGHVLGVLDPGPYGSVPGSQIVSVLGTRDGVTPFASGKTLLDRWAVPEANRFLVWRGHFSIPASLWLDPKPVHHFCDLLRKLKRTG